MTDRALIEYLVNQFEGSKYTDLATDCGGPTRFGVTRDNLAEFQGVPLGQITAAEIIALTRAQAVTILLALFMAKPGLGKIVNARLKLAAVNYAILSGRTPAIRALQKATGVVQDGIFGPASVTVVNASDPAEVRELVLADHLARLGHLITTADREEKQKITVLIDQLDPDRRC